MRLPSSVMNSSKYHHLHHKHFPMCIHQSSENSFHRKRPSVQFASPVSICTYEKLDCSRVATWVTLQTSLSRPHKARVLRPSSSSGTVSVESMQILLVEQIIPDRLRLPRDPYLIPFSSHRPETACYSYSCRWCVPPWSTIIISTTPPSLLNMFFSHTHVSLCIE